MKLVALIPAHNEGKDIRATVESVQASVRKPDRIVVMGDNCTDDTIAIARAAGADTMESVDNKDRKAGALNQALDSILPGLADDDLLLIMDADTVLEQTMTQNASVRFAQQPRLGAVSSNHLIDKSRTFIELLQAMEYERDRRFIGRRKGKYGCMTGMAAMYRVKAFRDVHAKYGHYYDPVNWTEDWKLTMVLKELEWDMVRPQDCLATTVPVSDIRGLFVQRERWARGYIQTLMQIGMTKVTAIPWLKQLGLVWSVCSRFILLYLLFVSRHHLFATWMIPVFAILIGDSVNTVKRAGWKAMLCAVAFPIEIVYAWVITFAIASGYFKEITGFGSNDQWKRVRA